MNRGVAALTLCALASLAGLAQADDATPLAFITNQGADTVSVISLVDGSTRKTLWRAHDGTLIESVLMHMREREKPYRILDLGTGSGALLLAALAEWPEAQGLGIDASDIALEIAHANARRLGLASRAQFRKGNWASALSERFDLILCNPPYVELDADLPADVKGYEPQSALFAGADGLDAYRHLIPQLPSLLNPFGMIAVEIGATQAAAVSELFVANGLTPQVRQDLGGRDRAVVHFSLGLDGKGR